MSARARFQALLDQLAIGRGALVYLHSSYSRLAHLELSPGELLDALIDRLGPAGTLILPSFAWNLDRTQRPWQGYADYYRKRPPFDVRSTPANIGVVPELFRSYAGVRRSAQFWWSVAACGPLADEITSDQDEIVLPFGPDSAFGRMHRLDATILGLGVTLNTTSLAPVVDHVLGSCHPQQLFSREPESGTVIDHWGRRKETKSYWLLPPVVRLIRPSEVVSRTDDLGGAVRRADHGAVIQFAYPFREYFSRALALGTAAAAARQAVPWLEGYPLR